MIQSNVGKLRILQPARPRQVLLSTISKKKVPSGVDSSGFTETQDIFGNFLHSARLSSSLGSPAIALQKSLTTITCYSLRSH